MKGKRGQGYRLSKMERNMRFRQRFETNDDSGAYKLTADGCCKKYQTPREEMYLTKWENRVRNLETFNRSDREEARIINKLAYYITNGYKLRVEETIEEFVVRCDEFANRI